MRKFENFELEIINNLIEDYLNREENLKHFDIVLNIQKDILGELTNKYINDYSTIIDKYNQEWNIVAQGNINNHGYNYILKNSDGLIDIVTENELKGFSNGDWNYKTNYQKENENENIII